MIEVNEEATSSKSRPLQLGFIGDVLFGELLENYGRGVRTKMARRGMDPFRHCRAEFAKNDLNVANLECILSETSDRRGFFREILRAPASTAKALVDAGIGVVSLANNHALDHGREAMLECVDILESNGITVVGVQQGKLRQTEPVLMRVKGVNLVLWSFNLANLSPEEFESRGQEIVGRIQESAAAGRVMTLMHWGEEYTSIPPQGIYRLAKRMAAAGASIICGHHSHRLQGISMIEGTVFAPSMGNFVFDDRRKESTLTAMMRVRLGDEGIPEWESVPFTINRDFQPQLDESRRVDLDALDVSLARLIAEAETGGSKIETQIFRDVAKGHRVNRIRMRLLMLLHFSRYRGGYADIVRHLSGMDRQKFSVSDACEWQ